MLKRVVTVVCVAAASALVAALVYPLISKVYGRRKIRRKRRDIIVVSSTDEYHIQHHKLLDELRVVKVLGLDCEWNTVDKTRRPVSLLQLSTQTGFCLLLRLHRFLVIPAELKDVLANRSILKCGVGITQDARYLLADYSIVVTSCVDLRHVFMRCRRTQLELKLSLRNLAKTVVGVRMDKTSFIRCSNWEADCLSSAQVEYAAHDAIVAVDIFTQMGLNKISNYDYSLENFNRKLLSLVQGIIDIDFKDRALKNRKKNVPDPSHLSPKVLKANNAYKGRTAPLYENAHLLAPDDQLLCTCSVSKARWYVEKGIGGYVSQEPLVVRLLFEPRGRPETEHNYYTQEKNNICVVCGAEDSHIRKHIVPKEYRRFFPAVMKEHKSHDVLLLCISCHCRSGLQDGILKQRLAVECDAPISGDAKFIVDKDLDNLRSFARAILKSRERIPADRLLVLETRLKEYYQVEEVSDELLKEIATVQTTKENQSYIPHGVKIVRHRMEHGGLLLFERLWRQHFLDTMRPQNLPEFWTVDHNHEKLYQYDQELQTNSELREEVLASCGFDD